MKRRWKVVLGVAGALVVLLTVNTIVLESQTKEAAPTVPDGRILRLGNGDLQITDSGDPARGPGQPIVLLHGYAGSLRWFDRLLPRLSPDHRVLRIDLLGFGGSEKPATGYEITNQARLVAEALNKLGVRGALVVGHSMGGAVTASLAEQASELVDRAVLIDEAPAESDAYGFHLGLLEKLTYVPVLGEALWRTTPDFAVRDGLKVAFAPGFDFAAGFNDAGDPVSDFRRMTYTSYSDAYSAERDFLAAKPLNERLTAASVPLMVLFGDEDQLFDAAAALAAYDDVPGARLATIPGAGHSPQVERPGRVAALIERFSAASDVPASTSASTAGRAQAKSNRQTSRKRASGRKQQRGSRKGGGSSRNR